MLLTRDVQAELAHGQLVDITDQELTTAVASGERNAPRTSSNASGTSSRFTSDPARSTTNTAPDFFFHSARRFPSADTLQRGSPAHAIATATTSPRVIPRASFTIFV